MSNDLSPMQHEAIGQFLVASSRLEYHVHEMRKILLEMEGVTDEKKKNKIFMLRNLVLDLAGEALKLRTPDKTSDHFLIWLGKAIFVAVHRNHIAHGYAQPSLANPEWIVVPHKQMHDKRTAAPTYSIGPIDQKENPHNIEVLDLHQLTLWATECQWNLDEWREHVKKWRQPSSA